MSEVLTEFIAPYAMAATTEERYRKLVLVAVVAWNAWLFPPRERRLILDSIIDEAMPYGAEDMKLVIQELIQRKDRYPISLVTRSSCSIQGTDLPRNL